MLSQQGISLEGMSKERASFVSRCFRGLVCS